MVLIWCGVVVCVENMRVVYLIEFIFNVRLLCVGFYLKNVILLLCDVFGVLLFVSKLIYL